MNRKMIKHHKIWRDMEGSAYARYINRRLRHRVNIGDRDYTIRESMNHIKIYTWDMADPTDRRQETGRRTNISKYVRI